MASAITRSFSVKYRLGPLAKTALAKTTTQARRQGIGAGRTRWINRPKRMGQK